MEILGNILASIRWTYDVSLSFAIVGPSGTARSLDERVFAVEEVGAAQLLSKVALKSILVYLLPVTKLPLFNTLKSSHW